MKIWIDRFYDDFDVCSTFYKFTSSTTHNEYNPLWVTKNVNILVPQTSQTFFMLISMSVVHPSSLRLLRRTTSIIPYEWRKNSVIQKVPYTTHISCFMMIYVFSTFCKFQSGTTQNEFSSLRVTGQLKYIHKFQGTAKIAGFMMI